MAKTGFARRRDDNEAEIVDALEAVGAVVERLNAKGVPDLLVGFREQTKLLEVKGTEVRGRGKNKRVVPRAFTPDQEVWFSQWCGEQPVVVCSIEEALTAIGLYIVSPGMYSYCPHHPQCDGREPRCCCADEHILSTYPRSKS